MFGKRKTGLQIEIDQLKAQLRTILEVRNELAGKVTSLSDKLDNEKAYSSRLNNQIEYLVRTIRDMDEQIFKMSQCTSFDGMRPNFQNLVEGMTVRKRQESDRIGAIIRKELITTYKPSENTHERVPAIRDGSRTDK